MASLQIDLPIVEITEYLESMLDQLGSSCIINGISSKMMLSDLQSNTNKLQENSKQAVISKNVPIYRGDKISFDDGRVAIVYTIPTDDIVSYSMKILMCNAQVVNERYQEVLDARTGDVLSSGDDAVGTIDCFIERISAYEKQFDVGIIKDATIKLISHDNIDILEQDTIMFKGKKYKVVDIDNITDGLYTVQLSSVRT